ncbi:MAG: isoprenylcysteine carboxylmethyltransferase family protein [Planctomycetota bacterium]
MTAEGGAPLILPAQAVPAVRLPLGALALPLAALLGARLWAQHRLKQQAPLQAPARGWPSVVSWFLIFVALIGAALLAAARGELTPARYALGFALVLPSLALRAAALRAIGGWYHEGIAVRVGQQVVREGVYRRLRHPLHLALLVEMAGLATWAGSALPWAGVLLALGIALARNHGEERAMLRALGAPYRAYLAGPAWDLVDLLPGRRRPDDEDEAVRAA